MFRAFLARLASGGFGAGLRARLFRFFLDTTTPTNGANQKGPRPPEE
jgi:hypothetical protein